MECRPRAFPAIPFPPRWRSDACRWHRARGRSRRRPVQAMDALSVMARGCPIRACWRSGCSNHGVESGVGFSTDRLLVPAQRFAHQPRRHDRSGSSSRHDSTKNRGDRARRNGVRLHALVGRHHPGGSRCPAGRAGARGRGLGQPTRAFRFSAVGRDGGRMRAPRWRPSAFPAIRFPPRWRSDACRWNGVRGRSRR
jgi:hypothetical protein